MSPHHDAPPSGPDAPRLAPLDDDRWFEEEVQAHEPVLRSYLQRRFPQLTDVDDVVQESYLRTLRAHLAGTLRSAKGFLFASARNAALDIFRHRTVIRFESLTEKTTSSVFSDGASPSETACLNQELQILAEALRHLPDRCRQILILRRIHGLSHKEIAEKLSISEHTVEKQVGIGLRKCVGFMRSQGIVIPKKL
jgi:RNA polymerase sigma factor (sigma-70 family)